MRRLAACCALLLASACTVGPDFTRPADPDIAAWKDNKPGDPAIDLSAKPDPQWWNGFKDPVLTELIQTAVRDNLDLQQAVLRVIEARQNVVSARAAGLPQVNGTASYQREQLGAKGILQSRGAYQQLNALADQNSTVNQASPGLGGQLDTTGTRLLNGITQPINLFQYGLDSSWELDLFGRVRRSVEQAEATTQAQGEAANDALLMLQSEVAQSYVQLRGAQALYASQEENVRSARDTLLLTQRLQRQGLGTMLDVDQARTQLLGYERQLPQYENQVQQAVNSLSVLIGQPPGALDARLLKPAPLPRTPQAVGVGVPSMLARRRPDIRQAEAQLHAATAGIGVAVASFYPDISLTGNLGFRALDAGYLTRWASFFYSAGPSLSLPIFQGGRLTANLRLARAQAIEAALRYRGTVLNALREVENGLVAYRTDRDQRDKLVQQVQSGQDTLDLATNSYAHGLITFIQVLDDQRTLIGARQQLVQQEMTLANDVVALYRALGGGWEDPGADSQAPEVPGAPPVTPAALDSLAAGRSNAR